MSQHNAPNRKAILKRVGGHRQGAGPAHYFDTGDQSLHPMWNHELQALPPASQAHFVSKQSVQRVSICVSLQVTDMKLLCVSHRCQRAPCRATWMLQTSSQSQNPISQFEYLHAWLIIYKPFDSHWTQPPSISLLLSENLLHLVERIGVIHSDKAIF